MTDRATQRARVRHALCLVVDRLLDWVPSPYARGRLLALLGAEIGRNVRLHSVRFINLESGFTHLHVADDAHIGTDCLIDLSDQVHIGQGAVLAPRAVVLTHQDAGDHHGSPVARVLGTHHAPAVIGAGAFVGSGAIVLCGAELGHHSVVAAGAVVADAVEPGSVVAGVPARRVRSIRSELEQLGVTFETGSRNAR